MIKAIPSFPPTVSHSHVHTSPRCTRTDAMKVQSWTNRLTSSSPFSKGGKSAGHNSQAMNRPQSNTTSRTMAHAWTLGDMMERRTCGTVFTCECHGNGGCYAALLFCSLSGGSGLFLQTGAEYLQRCSNIQPLSYKHWWGGYVLLITRRFVNNPKERMKIDQQLVRRGTYGWASARTGESAVFLCQRHSISPVTRWSHCARFQ